LAGGLVERAFSMLQPASTGDGESQNVVAVIEEARGELERVNKEAHRIAGLEV
jgi:hypothetical protein